MKIVRIGMRNFRNLVEANVSTDAPVVALVGKNGAGKTSFLECVYSSLLLSSFRTSRLSDAVCHGKRTCLIACQVDRGGSEIEVKTTFGTGGKFVTVNGNSVLGYAKLLELFRVVVLSHDDRAILVSGPDQRRRYANQALCLLDSSFAGLLRSYSRLLKGRNKALKARRYDVLDAMDVQMSSIGFRIFSARQYLVPLLEKWINMTCRDVLLFSQGISVEYASGCCGVSSVEEYLRLLSCSRERDMAIGSTTFGPHRDDILFKCDGRPAKEILSAGQIRILSIALKLALIALIRERSGFSPVAMADDAFLELDEERKLSAFKHLLSCRQVFCSFLPQEDFYLEFQDRMIIYGMDNGIIRSRNGRV